MILEEVEKFNIDNNTVVLRSRTNKIWALYDEEGVMIRFLNRYENGFINAAMAAVEEKYAPMKQRMEGLEK